MKQIRNTLFVTTPDVYLTLEGENAVAKQENEIRGRFPLHALMQIVTFSYAGASPALMGACAARGIGLAFCTPRGRFLARVTGMSIGNVLLRHEQCRLADDPSRSLPIVRNMILGKIYNQRRTLDRTRRDHAMRANVEALRAASETLKILAEQVSTCETFPALRGLEGAAAAEYFDVFDELFLQDPDTFFFHGRSRRPPRDPVNALLSFLYMLLAHDCASALEAAGLDASIGFMHVDRPGRKSLALDMMEELRPCLADRMTATLVNNRIVQKGHFDKQESGGVLLNETGRKHVLKHWQDRKREEIRHPYLDEKVHWGLVPYVQALLLARHMRGEMDGYPAFLW